MKIVLDSNVLISAIGKKSENRIIWDSFLKNIFTIVITPSILLEYEEILQQKAAPGASDLVIEIIREIPNVIFRDTYYHWNMISKDEDDNKFFDAAVAEQVDYLVTNDKHFIEAIQKGFPFVKIVSAESLKSIIENIVK
jgi:putative PIN family toxin of toxin-antitoxin system